MRVQEYLLSRGLVTPAQMCEALQQQRESRPPLGMIALGDGVMELRDVQTVLMWQRFEAGRPFGEIARDFGYFTEARLQRLLRT